MVLQVQMIAMENCKPPFDSRVDGSSSLSSRCLAAYRPACGTVTDRSQLPFYVKGASLGSPDSVNTPKRNCPHYGRALRRA